MKKLKKWAALFVMAAGLVTAAPMTAFAFTEEGTQTETVPETETPTAVEENAEEEGEKTGATPFSVPGNGQLLDEKADDDTKEFLTVQTKNGNTFFLVLDRSSQTENVYMLSMIDENDLAEFVKDTDMQGEKETETPKVVIPEAEEEAVETKPETEPEEQPEGMNTGAVLALVLLLAGGIGGFYYLKVIKPKKDEEDADGEDLEFDDGGEYINEDQPEDSEDGEE